jgi:hypothetical protein
VKTEKVPQKLSAAYASNVSLKPDSVPEPVVIVISSGKFTRQLTIHRPIGTTPLGDECWIITQTGDVPTLLNHAKDPSYEKKAEARRALRKAVAIKLGLISEDGTYLGDLAAKGAKSLAAGLLDAKKAYESAQKQAHELYIREQTAAGKTPKTDWKFNQDVNHFLKQEVKDAEALLLEKVKQAPEWAAGLKLIEPEPFETKGGPFHTVSQVPFCANKCGADQMVDMMQQHILSSITGTEGRFFPMGTNNPAFGFESKVVAAPAGTKEDPAKQQSEPQPMNRKSFLEAARARFLARGPQATPVTKT